MKPLELELKGFKGIRAGFGVDSIRFNFRGLSKGLVAIIGDNGRGKSTILGNMHPYRIMPDKAGKNYSPRSFNYYNECYGEARKELIFEMDGSEYKSLILIDADKRKTRAYLYKKNNNNWEVYGDTDTGNVEDYDSAIENLVGSPRMFFTSIFRCQKAPSLSNYTRGEMMDIFSELLLTDDLKEMAGNALEISNTYYSLLKEQKNKLSELEEKVIKLEPDNINKKADIEGRLKVLNKEILHYEREVKRVEGAIRDIEIKISLGEEALKNKLRIEDEIKNKDKRINSLNMSLIEKKDLYNNKYKALKARISSTQALIEKIPVLRGLAEEEKVKTSEVLKEKENFLSLDREYEKLNSEIGKIAQVELQIKDLDKEVQRIRLAKKHEVTTAENKLKQAVKNAERLEQVPCKDMDISRVCPLIKDAVLDRDSLPAIEEEFRAAQEENPRESQILARIEELKAEVKDKPSIEEKIREIQALKASLSEKINSLEKELVKIRESLKMLPQAEEAERLMPELNKELESIMEEGRRVISEIEEEIKRALEEKEALGKELSEISIDATLDTQKQNLQAQIDTLIREIEEIKKEKEEKIMALGSIDQSLKQIEESREVLKEVSKRIEKLNKEISEWQIIASALEGIITLEIDDAGPAVTALANDLLHSCYGKRFSVKIKTQEPKVGSDEMKEVFDIEIIDSERGDKKSLSDMSGGEETWIDDAIAKAICLFNASRSGKKYITLFSDEKDGRLSAIRKREFVEVKRRVIEIGGFEREYFVSHTPDIQQMADDSINLDDK